MNNIIKTVNFVTLIVIHFFFIIFIYFIQGQITKHSKKDKNENCDVM